jgi:hypothetical protein
MSQPPPETPEPAALVDAYNAVFSVRGGAPLATPGPHVEYVEDRLRVLLGGAPFAPLDLSRVRALSQPDLLRLLFRAVAGAYVTGPSPALRPGACAIRADQVTGGLELVRVGGDHEALLTVIAVVLLCVLAAVMYRRDRPPRGV